MCGLFKKAEDTVKGLSGNSIGSIIGVGTTPMTEEDIKPSEGFYKNPSDVAKENTAKDTTKNTAK